VIDAVLTCPSCGGRNLHQLDVDIFAREENAVTGWRMCVRGLDHCHGLAPEASVSPGLSGNPSARRGGILVRLACEECHGSCELRIAQHKGQTTVRLAALSPSPDEGVNRH
jgi:hypothetical protein